MEVRQTDINGFSSCIQNVSIFILLAVPGYLATKKRLLDKRETDGLSKVLVNILWPAMVIDTMNHTPVTSVHLHMAWYIGKVAAAVYIISLVLIFAYAKARKMSENLAGIFVFAVVVNNTGFIGMPFIKEVLGQEGLFAASIIELVNDLFIFTIGTLLIQYGTTGSKRMDIRNLLTPGFISVILGILLFASSFKLPDVIGKPVEYMSNATTGISMFVVGAQLGELSLREVFRDKKVYEQSFLRMCVIPIVLLVMLALFGGEHSLENQVLVLMMAMPTATCTAILARQYKRDYRQATRMVVLSTFSAALLLPVWLYITTNLF